MMTKKQKSICEKQENHKVLDLKICSIKLTAQKKMVGNKNTYGDGVNKGGPLGATVWATVSRRGSHQRLAPIIRPHARNIGIFNKHRGGRRVKLLLLVNPLALERVVGAILRKEGDDGALGLVSFVRE